MQLKERQRKWRKILVGNSLIMVIQRDFGRLPETCVLHKVQYCAWYLQTGQGSLWDNHAQRNIQFNEFQWFEWVMFWDEIAPYPDDHFKLGRYLGPNIDIGAAMVVKIIKGNGQVLHRSTYWALTKEEWEWAECKAEHNLFMDLPHQRLGPHAMVGDLF